MAVTYPIDPVLPEITAAFRTNPVVIIQAPPGAGKTTRVPPALMEDLSCRQGKIVMLEPRRLAAVAAARWMARQLGEAVGQTVGYTIRFASRISPATRLEVVTEGILTRRLLDDPTLEGVSLVIFDEFHERSLQADLALALCLDIRRGLREDLKLLVMSATLETERLAALLGNPPVIASPGQSFPVTEHHLSAGERGRERTWEERVTGAIGHALAETAGDILVFLPGSGEIRRVAARLADSPPAREGGLTVHPLYGDLPFAAQEAAIMPGRKRKIVLATNIAETSLTIEGVRVVIDGGLTRRLRYDAASGMNRLVTVRISQAEAIQRRGRAGRVAPGVCYRLYSPHDFQTMTPYPPPEILIADLSALVLELAAWGIKDPASLSWLDPPPAPAWETARELLATLGALDRRGDITTAGRALVRLPLPPRLGCLLLRAAERGCAPLGADLAALLSERDIRRRAPEDRPPAADDADLAARLFLFQDWRQKQRRDEKTAPADPAALAAVDRTAAQLRRLVAGSLPSPAVLPGKKPRGPAARRHGPVNNAGNEKHQEGKEEAIAALLLHAYPDRVARRRDGEGNGYLLSGGRGVRLPGESDLKGSAYLVVPRLDGRDKASGLIHLAAAVTEEVIRRELADRLTIRRRVAWDRQGGRILAREEECLGAIVMAERPFPVADGEALPLLCEVVGTREVLLDFHPEVRQFQGRVALLRRTFPEESWPDLSEAVLLNDPEIWLAPWLTGIRTAAQLTRLDLLPALRATLSPTQRRLLDERAPIALTVPSGRRLPLDYTAGPAPVLAVKLQEMFGLAATPTVAGGRATVVIHLLSPAGRPVQITEDLQGFWERGYPQVKKELQGRYPKHPWPDDPWSAVPTARTGRRRQNS